MSGHILVTWALANLLHPLIIFFYTGIGTAGPDLSDIGPFFQLMLISFIFSMPSLLLGLLAGIVISRLEGADSLKWLAWLFIAPLIALLNWFLIFFLFNGTFSGIQDIDIAMPSMIAVVVVVVLRTHYFLTAVSRDREERNLLDETTWPGNE